VRLSHHLSYLKVRKVGLPPPFFQTRNSSISEKRGQAHLPDLENLRRYSTLIRVHLLSLIG